MEYLGHDKLNEKLFTEVTKQLDFVVPLKIKEKGKEMKTFLG